MAPPPGLADLRADGHEPGHRGCSPGRAPDDRADRHLRLLRGVRRRRHLLVGFDERRDIVLVTLDTMAAGTSRTVHLHVPLRRPTWLPGSVLSADETQVQDAAGTRIPGRRSAPPCRPERRSRSPSPRTTDPPARGWRPRIRLALRKPRCRRAPGHAARAHAAGGDECPRRRRWHGERRHDHVGARDARPGGDRRAPGARARREARARRSRRARGAGGHRERRNRRRGQRRDPGAGHDARPGHHVRSGSGEAGRASSPIT